MNYVLAASRPGYAELVAQLEVATGATFTLIENSAELTREHLDRIKPARVFLPHWSHLIPREIHEEYECVIFHMTDLPFGRGGSPLQNLVVRGITHTQLSALRCVAEIDAGPIYLKKPLSLEGTAEEIYRRGAKLVGEMIAEIIATSPEPVAQKGEVVTFKRRRPEQSNLAGITDPQKIYDHIRMLDAAGYPHAFVEVAGMRLEFTEARIENGEVSAKAHLKPTGKDEPQ